jgi:hypothetical protein
MVLPAVSRSVTAAVYARFGETPRAPAQAEVTSCSTMISSGHFICEGGIHFVLEGLRHRRNHTHDHGIVVGWVDHASPQYGLSVMDVNSVCRI